MTSQDIAVAMNEAYIQGLEQAKHVLDLHKEYGNDIDYPIATLEEIIKNRKAELTNQKDEK